MPTKAMWESMLRAFDVVQASIPQRACPEWTHNYLCHRAAECRTGEIGAWSHVYMVHAALDLDGVTRCGGFYKEGSPMDEWPESPAEANVLRREWLLKQIAAYE